MEYNINLNMLLLAVIFAMLCTVGLMLVRVYVVYVDVHSIFLLELSGD